MDFSIIQNILEWVLPVGWLATLVGWWRDRKIYKVRNIKESEGTYKTLYDDLSVTITNLSKQIQKLDEKNINNQIAIRKCYACKYVERCPVVIFLRQQQKGKLGSSPLGQPQHERNRANGLRAGPEADGDAVGECGTVDDPG